MINMKLLTLCVTVTLASCALGNVLFIKYVGKCEVSVSGNGSDPPLDIAAPEVMTSSVSEQECAVMCSMRPDCRMFGCEQNGPGGCEQNGPGYLFHHYYNCSILAQFGGMAYKVKVKWFIFFFMSIIFFKIYLNLNSLS